MPLWCGSCYSRQAFQGQCRRPDHDDDDVDDYEEYEDVHDDDHGGIVKMINLHFGNGVARPGAAKPEM